MMARLLRRIILMQLLVGIGLGWAVGSAAEVDTGTLIMLMAATAALTPAVFKVWLVLLSGVMSGRPGPSNVWWRAMLIECRAAFLIFLLRQPWSLSPPAFLAPLALPGRIPVLLVHGFVCNYRLWDTLAQDLRRVGHPVLAVNLEPVFASIDDYGVLIEQAVTELCRQTGATQVALIGHSMGGLAIRAWMRQQGTTRVARVITLGTPHVGTLAEPCPVTPNLRQMALYNPWLKELAASETPATRGLMRIALSAQDNIVFPQRKQTLDGAALQVFEGVGHLALVLDTRVRRWVLAQLDGL